MSCPVILGSAEKSYVIRLSQMFHEIIYKLLGRQTTDGSILWRNDYVKPAVRHSYATFLQKPAHGSLDGRG